MEADIRDFMKVQEMQRKGGLREALPMLRVMQAAAPVMEALVTGSDAWNRYLGYLQAQFDQAASRKHYAQDRLADPLVLAHEDLLKLKNDIVVADAILATLKFAMELPKAIIEDGHKVSEIISEFEAKNEIARQPKS